MGLPEQVCSTEDETTKKRLPSFNILGTLLKPFSILDDVIHPIGKVMSLLQRMLTRADATHIRVPTSDVTEISKLSPKYSVLRFFCMNFWDNRRVLFGAREGDLLVFPRGLYSHWAVYVGNEEVVHLTGDSNTSSNGVKGIVKREDFWKVAQNSKAQINNSLDELFSPYPAHEIVIRAQMKIGEIGYNVVFKNCVHFALDCRYGLHSSNEVLSIIPIPLSMSGAAPVGSISGE